jgi:aldose 1-epimerase
MFLWGCAAPPKDATRLTHKTYGTVDGKEVEIYTLRNLKGAEARISTYGGILQSLKMPDRTGAMGDVVLGFDNLEDYLKSSNPYFSALIGRYGNRIGGAKFTLEGVNYTLAANNGTNSLHGGRKGFDKVIWTARPVDSIKGPGVELTYVSMDGEEGYPGTLTVKAVYTLTEDNTLHVEFTASTDKATVVNLTHHPYFNLAGKGTVLDHLLYIDAEKTTPVDSGLIPTGDLKDVQATPFDFRKPMTVGSRIDTDDQQLRYGRGYDHNWVINKSPGVLGLMARISEPTSGRILEIWSTEPGIQFYSANFLDGSLTGKGGWVYQRHAGMAMECQHFPDSPNHPRFPTTELKPGQTFKSTIIYKFTAK